ncbi:MAG: cytochrome c oxidase assembly protein [Candidatus Hodgkinia cicadicola]
MKRMIKFKADASAAFKGCLLFSLTLFLGCFVIARNYKKMCASSASSTRNLSRQVRETKLNVSFLAQNDKQLSWILKPNTAWVSLAVGEIIRVSYTARNATAQPAVGKATYSVAPPIAGKYFSKVQCFCFKRIYIPPKTTINLPLVFYISPEICSDERLDT